MIFKILQPFGVYRNLTFCITKRFFSSKDLVVRPEYISKLRECYRVEETQKIVVPQFKRALLYGNNIAIKDHAGEYSYFQLYMQSKRLCRQIANMCGSCSCSTIGLIYSNDVLSILCLWACWMAGQIVMPLVVNSQSPYDELPNLLKSANVKMIINCKKDQQLESSNMANDLNISHIAIDHLFMSKHNYPLNLNREIFIADNVVFFEGLLQNNFYTNSLAMLFYHKNELDPNKWQFVTVSHKELDMQMKLFVQTWNISAEDRILNVFSKQRVNDFMESSMFALNKGCCLNLMEPYEAANVWSLLIGINMPNKERVNVILADSKVYDDLIMEYDKIFAKNSRMVEYLKEYCGNKLRLTVSCFDKVSPETYKRWLEITGHSLFETSSICGPEVLKRQQTEDMEVQEPIITKDSLASGALKFRIVDSRNKILLECNGKARNLLYTTSPTVVGSLWISSANRKNNKVHNESEEADSFFSTGDVVMYQDGIFKFVGRCNQQ